ncbi:MAG: hypothetical protein CMP12_02890 [Zunongwangia sp.]|uniref:Uncharacterized protein n=1 Tax=Zunongwangia profunda TaxID=398743 RepID=A0A3D5IYC5_9FLAO|nr:hypothetical protein [Zunongwangia profunda]MAC65686.1 hypothetical protein [Flavobacteriaceae bacterium]MAO34851.1 hypothetical protein [Zunongwangia sp.]MCC4229849.1 hypothetical protein [Zunongwangia profunda]HCV80747.1 hypothetical protein [Zunongwangia profunda]
MLKVELKNSFFKAIKKKETKNQYYPKVLIKSNIVLLFVIVVKTMKNCAAGSGVLPSGAVAERMCNFSAVFQDIKNKTRLFVSFYGNDKKKVY